MKLHNYISSRNDIAEAVENSLNIWQNEDLVRQFNLVSAGLTNYLPDIDFSRHESIYKGLLLHQHLSSLEQSFFQTLEFVSYENLSNSLFKLLKEKPTIISTFHTGSYRIINHFLTKNQVPYALVIARDVLKKQGALIKKLYSDYYDGYLCDELVLIDAEDATSGIQMIREIKKGKSLLLYIDGNVGAGEKTRNNENTCEIKFLNQNINARKGIGYLAHSLNIPVINILCFRKNLEEIVLKFSDPIFPDLEEVRSVSAQNITQEIYGRASEIISKYPEQWEAWLYLHKVTKIVNSVSFEKISTSINKKPSASYTFNTKQYGIFKIAKQTYLFDKLSYLSYAIEADIYNMLHNAIFKPVDKKDINSQLFKQLFNKDVLLST
jgi:lauroyl/myristoyl acyltransferase